MQRLERARRFLLGRTRALGLKVIPLAMVIAPIGAMAGTFNITGQTANLASGQAYFQYFGSGFSVSTPTYDNVNGFQGVALTGSVSFYCCGFQDNGCGTEPIDFQISGNVSLASGDVLPTSGHLAYDFYVTNPDGSSFSYSTVNNSGSGLSYGPANPVIGSGNFTINSSGNWTVDLTVTPDTVLDGDSLTITAPGNLTLDFTANSSVAATPEPSTIALGLAGVATLGFLRRKRKA